MRSKESTKEELSGDERKLAGMLAALPRVEAPPDFEFRLKARIAGREKVPGPTAGIIHGLRYALPVLLVLILAGIVFINYGPEPDSQGETLTAAAEVGTRPSSQPLPRVEAEPPKINEATTGVPRSRETATVSQPARQIASRIPERRKQAPAVDRGAGGSVDRALQTASNTILPRGLNPQRVITERPRGFDDSASIPVTDVFSHLGINAEFVRGGWRVQSVRPESLAIRSGIRAGDVIEAIDEDPVSEGTTLKIPWAGRAIKVRRNGSVLMLHLRTH